ncbi:MAG TPA: pyridoxamine 5'-phosphate oxidase family protein [Candidatus Limnocylindrales bacterium]|nr:pyridoxamine 5'-phosphate oxidase family protein [Candidatus Limnocylindrales bacterium]
MADGPLAEALRREDAAWARDHIETDIVAWLTTVTSDGRPQTSVISFLYEDGTILFYSKPGTPKLRNIQDDPQVSFNLQSDPYGDHYLVVEGTMAIDPTVPASDRHEAYRAKYLEPHAHWEMAVADVARDFSVPLRISPTRVRVA